MRDCDLEPLFRPRSSAVAGASSMPGTYQGAVNPVISLEHEFLGHRVYASPEAIRATVVLDALIMRDGGN